MKWISLGFYRSVNRFFSLIRIVPYKHNTESTILSLYWRIYLYTGKSGTVETRILAYFMS